MFRTLSTAVLLLLLALPGVALAQSTGTLTGTVVDDQGQTLIGASVRVEGTTLGAATNVEGQYRIIGVPVGEYSITASYIGFQSETQSGVAITNSVTRVVDFSLSNDAQLDEVIVEYQRPIIERSATAPRNISGKDIENLPVRNVTDVAALTSGVVESSQGLNIRGGRGGEVAYYVDGVRVNGSVAVNQAAIAEQELLIGTIPARYGDVQSGVISITTQTGRSDFFGSAEGVTSTGLDSYGYNLASLSLGGPIIPNRIGFFATAEGEFLDDASPYGISSLRLNDDMFDLIQLRPQALLFNGPEGATQYIPFPAEAFDGRSLQTPNGGAASITAAEIDAAYKEAGVVPEGFTRAAGAAGLAFVPTASTLTEESFDSQRGKDDPSTEYTVNGSLNFTVLPSVTLRVGGGYQNDDDRNFSYARSFYDRNYSQTQGEYWRTYGTLRQRVGTNAFYQLTAEYQNNYSTTRPEGIGSDLSQLLTYGDIDGARFAVASRYFNGVGTTGAQRVNYLDSDISVNQVDPGTFRLPGAADLSTVSDFSKSRTEQFGISGDASTQIGVHQIGFGGEYRQNTNRFFAINASDVSQYFADGTNVRVAQGIPATGVTSYDSLSYQAIQPLVTYYGYTFNGMEEVNDQDVDAFYNVNDDGLPQNTNLDAWRPYYYAGFITDRIEFNDLILDLGFRVDAYNANTLVLRDIFANEPIFRASDLDGMTVPGSIESDYGVYYAGGVVGNENIVGYRDLEGTIYDADGEQITIADLRAANGFHVRDESQNESTAFRESETDVTFMPRIGVSFPVTDRALFFASYNVLAQRPTQNSFTTFNRYVGATDASRLSNTGLQPQRTTQYEVGFRQRVAERAALTISGFYNTKENLIALRQADGGLTQYDYYTNQDFATTQGAELGFELRRTNNLALNANYTLAFAKATGSDASTLDVIAWRGDTFPNSVSPADFDQRHTVNVTADYRFGAGEGPMIGSTRPFENFGINLIGQFGSGQRYTPLQRCGNFNVNAPTTCNTTGDINSSVLPANYNLDLKLDRRFQLGFAQSTMQLYLIVLNVLDTENVLAVYRETGQVDNQGYFNGALGAQRLSTNPNPASTLFNYQSYAGGPVNVGGNQSSTGSFYGPPRRIRLGALFTF